MKLALGTVQFGLPYGIAGRQLAVPEGEVRSILECAWERGVRVLDTAAAYGDIEERLQRLCGQMPFQIISKIPAIPPGLEPSAAASWARMQAERSRHRLDGLLIGMMFHRAEDLLGERGLLIWSAVSEWADCAGIRLGVSCYDPRTCLSLSRSFRFSLAQLPGNVFDQRIATELPVALPGLEIYLRSVFLQGLLLMSRAEGEKRLPVAAAALDRWHAWCLERGVSQLIAALAVGKSFGAVSSILVGVDSLQQFIDIADGWDAADARVAATLAVQCPEIIDPRYWQL